MEVVDLDLPLYLLFDSGLVAKLKQFELLYSNPKLPPSSLIIPFSSTVTFLFRVHL